MSNPISYVTNWEDALQSGAVDPMSQPYLIADENNLFLHWNNLPTDEFSVLLGAARSRGRWTGNGWEFPDKKKWGFVLSVARGLKRSVREFASREAAMATLDAEAKSLAGAGQAVNIIAMRGGVWAVTAPAEFRLQSILDNSVLSRVVVNGGQRIGVTAVVGADHRQNRDRIAEIRDRCREAGYRIVVSRCVHARKTLTTEVRGWVVRLRLPIPECPWAAILCPADSYWAGRYPNGSRRHTRTEILGDGAEVEIPIPEWPSARELLVRMGFLIKGQEPDFAVSDPGIAASSFVQRPAGWDTPAPNGYSLFPYQQQGVVFIVSRKGRCLLGDEMGVGKTAQAIAGAQALGARRVVVVVPAAARYVWEGEIRGWLGPEAPIQHIRSATDQVVLGETGWLVVGYEQTIARQESWICADEAEESAVRGWLVETGQVGGDDEDEEGSDGEIVARQVRPGRARIQIPDEAKDVDGEPSLSEKRLKQWRKMILRMRSALLTEIEGWRPDLMIVDEAHRGKNADAKRTAALRRLAAGPNGVLLLTGTPVRNHGGDAINLLYLIDPGSMEYLTRRLAREGVRRRGQLHDNNRLKAMLKLLQIRRRKLDVLPELPPQLRETVMADVEIPDEYYDALHWAFEAYEKAKQDGATEGEARKEMLGGLSMARRILGGVKVGFAVEFIQELLQENDRKCCVVFCAHHDTTDAIAEALRKTGTRVGIVDGRIAAANRAQAVDDFQRGGLDVLIGGIQAAGEAITLHRADTVVFVEHDWVPGAIQQAEARIHRAGQTAETCWTYHLTVSEACLAPHENLDIMVWGALESKLRVINDLLDEQERLTDHAIGDGTVAGGVQAAVISRMLAQRPGNINGGGT